MKGRQMAEKRGLGVKALGTAVAKVSVFGGEMFGLQVLAGRVSVSKKFAAHIARIAAGLLGQILLG